jgi:hypothetical protein
VLPVLAGCANEGGEAVPFISLSQGELLRTDFQTAQPPALVVIAMPQEIDTFAQDVLDIYPQAKEPHDQRHRLVEQLRQVDYIQSVAVLVLQGMQSTLGYQVTVQQIRQQNDEIRIYTHFETPESIWDSIFGAKVRQSMISDAHHLVTIPKQTLANRQIRFVLIANDAPVAEVAHSIP